MSAPSGRAWLPASTSLPGDRPPTRAERFEAWKRQATGVYEMTRAVRAPGRAQARTTSLALGVQVLLGAGLLSGFVLLPPAMHGGLVTALHVVAAAALLMVQLTGPSVIVSDVIAEVGSKAGRAWAGSPLPTSAWVAGKVAWYGTTQLLASLRVLPLVAASSMLAGLRLRDATIVSVLGVAWTVVSGTAAASAALEPRPNLAARLAGRGGFLAQRLAMNPALRGNVPPAASVVVVQLALGMAGAIMLLPFAIGGAPAFSSLPGPVALVMGAFAIGSPVGAGISAFFPQLSVRALGLLVPLWLVSLLGAAAIAPAVVAAARLRWRPPDGSLGYGVRPTWWVAAVVFCLGVYAIGASTPAAVPVLGLALPVVAVGLTALLAGMTRLPDLAAGRVTGWRRIVGLDRGTAEVHALVTLAGVALALGTCMRGGTFARVPAIVGMLLVAAVASPLAWVLASVGREGRRTVAAFEAGEKATWRWRPAGTMLGVLVVAAASPVLSALATSLGAARVARALELGSILSPLAALVTLGRDVLGLASLPQTGGGLPASLGAAAVPVAFAAQLALGLAARRLERRAAAREGTLSFPPGALEPDK